MRNIAALVLAVCTLACEPREQADTALADPEAGNLLTLARGASVLERTGENMLTTSAAHAIDGDAESHWQMPNGGASQTMTVALAAPTRITRLGVMTTKEADGVPQKVQFAESNDAQTWRGVATIEPKATNDPQTVAVTPFDARFLRVSVIEPVEHTAFMRAVIVNGQELASRALPSLEGCWSINGLSSRFVQRGSSVSGVIGEASVTGGTDGRAFRIMWRKGPTWGVGIISVDPQRRALSGLRFFEDALNFRDNGGAWLGTPAPCVEARIDETEIAAAVLQRAARWMIYGDSAIDTAATLIRRAPSRRFRIVAPDAARMNAVRDALRSRGVDVARIGFEVAAAEANTEPQRALADGVALYGR